MVEKKGRGKIAALVEEIIRGPVESAGYLLWDVDYYKEGADYNLLVTIENPDREKPIDLDDCEKVSRMLSPLLDEKDPIADAYYLEVSSAGLERTLTRAEHFRFYLGQTVSVKLYAPLNGVKSLQATLLAFDEEGFTFLTSEEKLSLKKEAVAKIVTVMES